MEGERRRGSRGQWRKIRWREKRRIERERKF